MTIFNQVIDKRISGIYPVYKEANAFIISKLAEKIDKILFIANDDTVLEELAKQINFFAPDLKVVIFPSWDCLAYDKVSPNIQNLARRIEALDEILENKDKLIVVGSISSIYQYLPPKSLIPSFTKKILKGDSLIRDQFIQFLIQLSFRRVEVATEPGDFAVRGDIIDIVASPEEGWRIDFFGNLVEKIRIFDPLTQMTVKEVSHIKIMPSNEVIFNEKTIECFRKKFIEHFDEFSSDHPMFQAVVSGRKYPGMEHYLPFFYEKLDDIFSYFSPSYIVLDSEHQSYLDRFFQSIEENYEARRNQLTHRFQDEVIYYPLDPSLLWLNKNQLELRSENKIYLANFIPDNKNGIEISLKKVDNFELQAQSKKLSSFDLFKKYRDSNKSKTIIACYSEGSLNRVKSLLDNYNIHWFVIESFLDYKKISGKSVGLAIFPLKHGFTYDDFTIISEQDLLGEKIVRKKSKYSIEKLFEEINNIQVGEFVVHQKHGIGIFSGLETVSAGGIEHDCLKLIYADGDILYIPVENLDLLTRYGGDEENVRLDKLGGSAWHNRKEKLKQKLKEIAAQLINTAALRAKKEGEVLAPVAGSYEEFCKRFSYIETEDQYRSIKEVEEDLASGRPMDRLVCGDVGFGKTEVAMRAAFIATNPEKNIKQQVAVIVPTTLLARQHYNSFFKRFAGFNVTVKQYSRLVNSKELKKTKESLKEGNIDIVIGTHALLSKDIEFKNLGLLIVDEEQKFGVIQKERLKNLQENVHILTLSATPIPRTLQMSLTGVRDLSIIATPPIDRQVVKTYTMPYDSVVIREAIMREFYRGGQIFFVCPRISDISELLPKLKELVPEIKIVVAHGQMPPSSIEEIMTDFYNKKFHLLLSTSIIESGIDIAEANTMIVYRADRFGLSALYQLRGRVGRSNIKAYSYFLLPNHKLSKIAMARLEVMQTIDSLGAGFTVASHDMDIRGFGNLVGDEQSGHIKDVGLELYQQMLQEAIMAIKNPDTKDKDFEEEYSPQINLGIPVIIPDEYIEDLNLRLTLYRKLASFKKEQEIDQFAIEMIDRFGLYPKEVEYLIEVLKLKLAAKLVNVEKIDAGPKAITFTFKDNKCLKPEQMMEFVMRNQNYLKIRPDQKLLISKEFNNLDLKIKYIKELLLKLAF